MTIFPLHIVIVVLICCHIICLKVYFNFHSLCYYTLIAHLFVSYFYKNWMASHCLNVYIYLEIFICHEKVSFSWNVSYISAAGSLLFLSPSLLLWTEISVLYWIRMENEQSCLVFGFRVYGFHFSPFSMMLAIGLSYIG
jgi:hypothetical protein